MNSTRKSWRKPKHKQGAVGVGEMTRRLCQQTVAQPPSLFKGLRCKALAALALDRAFSGRAVKLVTKQMLLRVNQY